MKKPKPVALFPMLNRQKTGFGAHVPEFSLPPLRASEPLAHWVAVGGEVVLFLFGVLNFVAGEYVAAALTLLPLCMIITDQIFNVMGRDWPFSPALILFVLALTHLTLAWMLTPMVLLWAYPSLVGAFLVTQSRNVNIYAAIMLVGGTAIAGGQGEYALAIRYPLALTSVWLFLFIMLRVVTDLRLTAFEQSITDPLTGCFNRRYLDSYMIAPHCHARGAFLLLDMDHFKDLNDEKGHAAGDQALCRLTMIAQKRFPDDVLCFRIGGDEFVLMLHPPYQHDRPVISLRDQDRHLTQLAKTVLKTLNADGSFSVSGGLAHFGWPGDFEDIYRRADVALYQAKDEGRGRLCVSDTPSAQTHPLLSQNEFSTEIMPQQQAV